MAGADYFDTCDVADRAGVAAVGTDFSLDRLASQVLAKSAGVGAIPCCVPGEPDVPAGGVFAADPATESKYLAQSIDGIWYAVVHPVQCGGGRFDDTE